MAKKNNRGQETLMDLLIGELVNAGDESSMIEICLSGNVKAISSIPLRYRLITLGLCKGFSVDELNQKLTENGCPTLYARNLREAVVIYCLSKHLSVEKWKELEAECASLVSEIKDRKDSLSASSLTMKDLYRYVFTDSTGTQETPVTQHETRRVEKELLSLSDDPEVFRAFITSNINSFSVVREKVRYYFCKYLYYYLEEQVEHYVKLLEKNKTEDSSLSFLDVFRVRSKLERKRYTPEEAREEIRNANLSPGGIYDAFHEFYFEYTSLDWLQIQLEYYGDLTTLDEGEKAELAAAIRKHERSMKRLSDDAIIEWQIEKMAREEEEADRFYSLDNKAALYQKGRSGEKFIRKILRGEIDLDRTTFLAFLVFFGKDASLPDGQKIDEKRLSAIIEQCGFPPLSRENPADAFFIDFLDAKDPLMFLTEEAEMLAFSEENFYLYKTYLASMSYDRKWDEITKSS